MSSLYILIHNLFPPAHGNLCRWWGQIDSSWSCSGAFCGLYLFPIIVDIFLSSNFYLIVTFFSTTLNYKSQRRIVSWMIFLMLLTSTKLLFLSKVLAEQQNWISCLLSVTSHQFAYILECHKKKGIYMFFWN